MAKPKKIIEMKKNKPMINWTIFVTCPHCQNEDARSETEALAHLGQKIICRDCKESFVCETRDSETDYIFKSVFN
jgi:transposase-like protein